MSSIHPQVVSKQRVADHGEVWTEPREVNAMLDLVKHETLRIDSRFLEPACGNGNFLTEILERKLAIVESRYAKSQVEFERYSVLAVTSIYGIDLLADNIAQCRNRLYAIFDSSYKRIFGSRAKPKCLEAVRFILDHNIICGDALTLRTLDSNYIVFCEWSPINGSMLKRRDFTFRTLLNPDDSDGSPLMSDQGVGVFIPAPERDYAPIHFLEIANAK